MTNFAVACGGTGGHLCPGIALAEELISRGESCLLIVSQKPIDSAILKKYDALEYVALPAKPLRKGFRSAIEFFKSQVNSLFQSFKLIKKKKIDCVLGMGGFTNVAIVLAAFLLRKKIILHESNRVIGRSIKLLSYFADAIFLPEGMTLKNNIFKRRKKILHASLPLRKEISKIDKNKAKKLLGLNPNHNVLTVFGGSQGAKVLNEWAIHNLKTLNYNEIAVCCVQGGNLIDLQKMVINKSEKGNEIKNIFFAFCENMSILLSATDLLICRAGAGSIAEAEYFKLPTILIPYPYAENNHQEANAIHARKNGNAIMLREDNINLLTGLILECFSKNLKNFKTHKHLGNGQSAAYIIANYTQKLVKS